jgi:hypothetical protein
VLIYASYVRQKNSYSRLQITKNDYQTLASECQAFPQLVSYLLNFEFKTRETEVGPPRINFRPKFDCKLASDRFVGFGMLTTPVPSLNLDKQSECAYMIRFIEFTNRAKRSPWSLRQYAVFHKWKIGSIPPCSTWMLFGASQRTEPCVNAYLEGVCDTYQAHPFELHIIFLDTAIASWRPYLVHLHDKVVDLVRCPSSASKVKLT